MALLLDHTWATMDHTWASKKLNNTINQSINQDFDYQILEGRKGINFTINTIRETLLHVSKNKPYCHICCSVFWTVTMVYTRSTRFHFCQPEMGKYVYNRTTMLWGWNMALANIYANTSNRDLVHHYYNAVWPIAKSNIVCSLLDNWETKQWYQELALLLCQLWPSFW